MLATRLALVANLLLPVLCFYVAFTQHNETAAKAFLTLYFVQPFVFVAAAARFVMRGEVVLGMLLALLAHLGGTVLFCLGFPWLSLLALPLPYILGNVLFLGLTAPKRPLQDMVLEGI